MLSVLTFRTPDEAVAKANNTQYGLSAGIWTEKGSRILAVANKLRAGVVWSNTFNKFDPTSPFGGCRSRASAARAVATAWRHTSMSDRLSVFKTYKLYVGGKFPAFRERPGVRGDRREGQLAGQRSLSSRKDARDAVVAARKAFGGWSGATAYNRGQVLYRVAEMLEGRK